MRKFRLNIDGKEVFALPGQTILDVARENGIFIPTLCYDDRTEIYGACGICVVEAEGNPKLLKACATEVMPGMIIMTDTERVRSSRKTNLELLLSNHVGDCRPPCVAACPAHTDCQGYVGLVANGMNEAAIRMIRDRIPLPGSIGRVCPHPCEDNCRRRLVEEPVAIAHIKRFAADFDYADGAPYIPETGEETGRHVAIIGGGPYGLSLAYFLRILGHGVTVFEAMPYAGGMLRYGIPEYRLPNAVLDDEISIIEAMGVEIITNNRIGADDFEALREEYDAVAVGVGAWVSTGTGAKGEDLPGVTGGIDFLRRVVRGEEISVGKRVAIVGGGNTAMDVCRSAVRLGAEQVYNIYRRTRDEMPADLIEIEEAEEEGVIFKNLRNPIEIVKGKDGSAASIVLQVMELGEPDASGRRAPVPVEGKTETLEIDNVILATGQAVDATGFEALEMTRKKGIVYDPETFMTSIPGVFAGGDCGNDKISIAIEAIADAHKTSSIIDSYLAGEEVAYAPDYGVERRDVDEKTFEDRERQCRKEMPMLTAEERRNHFIETALGYDTDVAVAEAERCLECGCGDYFECKLVDLANRYDVSRDRLSRLEGDFSLADPETGKPADPEKYDDGHPFIIRDSNKCILCGLCVRVCDEVMGIAALGLVNRGFDAIVKPTLEKPLDESGCVSCGQCVSVCPTGALQERLSLPKSVPLDTAVTDTTCPYCSVGCSISLHSYDELLVKANPKSDGVVNKGLLCGKGKFGFDCAEIEGKLLQPRMRRADGELEEAEYYDAFMTTARKAQAVAARYGRESVAVAISDRYTNEEIYAIRSLADELGARAVSLGSRENGLNRVLGLNASPNTMDELHSAEVILAVGFNTVDNPVVYLKLKQAAEAGAKLVLINPHELKQHGFAFAHKKEYLSNDVQFLKEIAKALIDSGSISPAAKDAEGFAEFEKSLAKVKASDAAVEIASLYAGAKKAMIVYQQNVLTSDAAALLCSIAAISGHIGKPRDGILLVRPKNNSQGLCDQGINETAMGLSGVKALLVFGEDPLGAAENCSAPEAIAAAKAVKEAEFVMVCDTHMTKTAEHANVVIPGTGFASVDGTFTNTERRLSIVQEAAAEDVEFANWEVAKGIASAFETEFPWESTEDISLEMDDELPIYRDSSVDEIFGGVLAPAALSFAAAADADGKLADRLMPMDNLMNMIAERLPKPADMPMDV
jgi:formate dehydrogenase major subunit